MNPEEVKEWIKLLQRVEDGGNDSADIYEAEEFCRFMEQKYKKPFNQLYGSKQNDMSERMNHQTHRLTDFPGERHPLICQQCGGCTGGDPSGDGKARIVRTGLDRWQECDHNDKPEHRLIVLCRKCSERMIEPHPRLYHRLHENDPWPGCMEICVTCKFRDGIKCSHPDAKINGGNGVMLSVGTPIRGFIDGAKYRGPFVHYPFPPKACKQKET